MRARSREESNKRQGESRRRMQEILETPCRTLLFSAEILENFTASEAGDLVDYLRNYTDRIEIIGFARAPRSSQLSSFQERVKHGWRHDHLPRISYRKSFLPYIEKLGPEAVHIIPFVPSTFINGSLVDTLLHAIGEPQVVYEEKRKNESMSEDAVRLLYNFNRTGSFPVEGRNNVRARARLWKTLTESIHGPKFELPLDCHTPGNMIEEVRWLKAVSGIDFTADLEGMEERENRASKRLLRAMQKISDDGAEQLANLVRSETKTCMSSPMDGMAALYRAYGG